MRATICVAAGAISAAAFVFDDGSALAFLLAIGAPWAAYGVRR